MADVHGAYKELEQTAAQEKAEALAALRQELLAAQATELPSGCSGEAAEAHQQHERALTSMRLDCLKHEAELLRGHAAALSAKDGMLQQMWAQVRDMRYAITTGLSWS